MRGFGMKIELQGICKSFDGKKRVLDEVCHCFESGKTYVIKGISGSGKTTLLNILSGLADKSSQEIVEAVKTGIADFVNGAEQSDDITMLVLKRK